MAPNLTMILTATSKLLYGVVRTQILSYRSRILHLSWFIQTSAEAYDSHSPSAQNEDLQTSRIIEMPGSFSSHSAYVYSSVLPLVVVAGALHRNSPDWQLEHCCPACMYT